MKRRRIYTIIVPILASIVIALAGAAYIAAITLPLKARTSVITEIEKATGKKIIFQSLKFSLLRGLVLERPVLYDDKAVLISAKEVSARFLILPIFQKKIIIPAIVIEEPSILLERRANNSFNISGLFPSGDMAKENSSFVIYRVLLKNGVIDFTDKTLAVPFTKTIEKALIDVRMALPAKIKFRVAGQVSSARQAVNVESAGEYLLYNRELSADISVKNISPDEFAPYYRASGFSFPKGSLDLKASVNIKDNVISADIDADAKAVAFSKDNMSGALDSGIKMMVQYKINEKALEYAGNLDIHSMDINAADTVGEIKNIKAKVEFDDSRVASENIRADILGIPWNVKINLVHFDKPLLDIYAGTEADLKVIKKMLGDNFGIKLPADVSGASNIDIAIHTEPDKPPKLNGSIRVDDATMKQLGGAHTLEHMSGEAKFTENTLTWAGINFAYGPTWYKTSGTLTNFESPGVQIKVSSKDLSLESAFSVNGKAIYLSQFAGKYLNSGFTATGEAYMGEQDSLDAKLKGVIEFNLKDLKNFTKGSPEFEKADIGGRATAEFSLDGNIGDMRRCAISANVRSSRILIYDLKLDNVVMDYLQENGRGDIKLMKALFYGGSIWATGNIDWLTKDVPYHVNLSAKEIKLSRLKDDTPIRSKDVSGDINLNTTINGYFKGAAPLTGVGKIDIAKGKLWQLDLFQGFGKMIFTSDFSEVVFSEGSCDFKIENKAFSTRDLLLKSDLLNVSGRGDIGFDKSVKVALKSELTEEAMEPGFKKNIATMIGRYASIEITGTVGEPKYSMKTSPGDLIEGFAKTYFEQ